MRVQQNRWRWARLGCRVGLASVTQWSTVTVLLAHLAWDKTRARRQERVKARKSDKTEDGTYTSI